MVIFHSTAFLTEAEFIRIFSHFYFPLKVDFVVYNTIYLVFANNFAVKLTKKKQCKKSVNAIKRTKWLNDFDPSCKHEKHRNFMQQTTT